jgi:xanthosine utilization system XapX-like protein
MCDRNMPGQQKMNNPIPLYSNAKRYILHARLFMAARFCSQVLPIIICLVYITLSIVSPKYSHICLFGILIVFISYGFIFMVNYIIALTLKCDNCKKPPTIRRKLKIGLKEEFSSGLMKKWKPVVPVQLVEKSFRCVHCGSEYSLSV